MAGYKQSAGDSASSWVSRMSPLLTGIGIGVLLGVLIALGFAMWLNRHATPFVEKAKGVESLPTKSANDPPKFDATQPGGVAPAPPVAKAGDKPRFDFYDILPGKDGKGGKAPVPPIARLDTKPEAKPSAAKDVPAAPVPAKEAMKDTPKEASKEVYMLQAGAFQNIGDAESLKAKIAFAGLDAVVKTVNFPDKGTLYRVRLGPYRSVDEMNRIKTALSQNGIAAAVVKTE